MPTVPDISTVIQIALISQYKWSRALASNKFYNKQPVDRTRAELIYITRKDVQWGFSVNPTDPALPKASEYLFGLCAPYIQEALQIISNTGQAKPIITGPTNQSVNVGNNATFSVSVTSSLPVTYQWYDSFGNPIIGATNSTYVFMNAQLSDTGKAFFVKATNAAGQTVSGVATLTVTASIEGQWYAGSTDYSAQLLAGTDSVPYNGTFPITDGQPFNVPFPIGQSDFVVIKYPISQALRIHYANPVAGIDQAAIPGLAFDENTFGGNNYTFSRNGNPFGINNTTGIVQFS